MRERTPVSHNLRRGIFYATRTPLVGRKAVADTGRIQRKTPGPQVPMVVTPAPVYGPRDTSIAAALVAEAPLPAYQGHAAEHSNSAAEQQSLRELWKQSARLQESFVSGLRQHRTHFEDPR